MKEDFFDRLDKYMAEKGLNDNKLTVLASLSIGSLGKQRKGSRGLSSDSIAKILHSCPDLSGDWLLTGEGEMLKRNFETKTTQNPVILNDRKNDRENDRKPKLHKTRSNKAEYTGEPLVSMVAEHTGVYETGKDDKAPKRDPRDVELLAAKDVIIQRDAKLIAALEHRISDLEKGLESARTAAGKTVPGATNPRL